MLNINLDCHRSRKESNNINETISTKTLFLISLALFYRLLGCYTFSSSPPDWFSSSVPESFSSIGVVSCISRVFSPVSAASAFSCSASSWASRIFLVESHFLHCCFCRLPHYHCAEVLKRCLIVDVDVVMSMSMMCVSLKLT